MLAGCWGATATPGLTTAPTAGQAATGAPSGATPAAQPSQAAGACIISTPQQVGADETPIVIAYEGYGEDQCAALLVVAADASEFAKAHPPTRLEAPPTTEPVCTKTLQGATLTVWGTTAAQVACSALK